MKKAVAVYLFVGGVVFFIQFLVRLEFLGFLESLWPALFTIAWYLFIITSGAAYLIRANSKTNENLVSISLAVQAIQFFILGLHFKNFFGPYLGVGITNRTRRTLSCRNGNS